MYSAATPDFVLPWTTVHFFYISAKIVSLVHLYIFNEGSEVDFQTGVMDINVGLVTADFKKDS